jgi:superfamily II DNA or RNA helicase
MRDILIAAIETVLKRGAPGYLCAATIAAELGKGGMPAVTAADVESTIEQDTVRFEMSHGDPPMWRFRERPAAATSRLPPLYAWQQEALKAWQQRRWRGIVEAVTGTGKTMVGIEAIRQSISQGGRVHVIVPTIELQNQWCDVIRDYLPTVRLGRRGDGSKAQFSKKDVIVSVVNSARGFEPERISPNSLLIADEAHRYGSQENAKSLHTALQRLLGLTATLERKDDGVDEKLAPYFGSVVFRMGYRRAIDDGVVAKVRLGLIGVEFASEAERERYKQLERESSEARAILIRHHDVPSEPFGEFMRAVALMSDNKAGDDGYLPSYDGIDWARRFLKAFTGKRELLANTASKLDALERIATLVKAANGTLVFTETIEGSEAAAERLEGADVRATAIHSGHNAQTRRDTLEDLRAGHLDAVCAPRILDEGIDVPDADLGIILAATRQRRQMIQRMERVLRKKVDGRHARFVVVYVKDTTEDPENGAREAFLEEITTVASAQKVFSPRASPNTIGNFLK